MIITLDDHPARQMVDGELVPLVPDQHCIRLDGIMVGYCSKHVGGFIQLIVVLDEATQDAIAAHVMQAIGQQTVTMVPDMEALNKSVFDEGEEENGEDSEPE